MPTSKNKHIVTVSVDKSVYEHFQRMYPCCDKEFIKRALYQAIQSRDFFDKVFFNPAYRG